MKKYQFGMFEYQIEWDQYHGEIRTPKRTYEIGTNSYSQWYLHIKGKDPDDDALLKGRVTHKTDRNTILAKCLTCINDIELKEL